MIRIVFTTFADEETAAAVSRLLVEKGLAACATLLPMARSIYRWEDEIQDEKEIMVIFKTTTVIYDLFLIELSKIHPYQTPELISMDADGASQAYLEWISAQCGSQPSHD